MSLSIFRSLSIKNYRLFFIGQGLSLTGSWMQTIALGWLVYRLTHSALMLGTVGFASAIWSFVLGPLGGMVADRYDKRTIIIITQALMMVQALLLTMLTLTGTITIPWIIALGIAGGLCGVFEMPARQAWMWELVGDKTLLPNAIALNSFIFNGARLIGPALAGVVVAAGGEGICFLINSLSFMAVLIMLFLIKTAALSPLSTSGLSALVRLRQGFAYAFKHPAIRSMLLLVAIISLVGISYGVLMPVFARDILHGSPRTLGFLMGSAGIGALLAALLLAERPDARHLPRFAAFGPLLLGGGLIAFSFSRNTLLSCIILGIVGFGQLLQMASSNTLLQAIVPDDKRGLVMSIYGMCFLGMMPLGSLMLGSLAQSFGAPLTTGICGLICVMAPFVFFKKILTITAT